MKHRYDLEWLISSIEDGNIHKYIFFWGHTKDRSKEVRNFAFSQWYESPFMVGNDIYKTSEHWMMAQKAALFENHQIFDKIISCDKPGEAKELGRRVMGFDESIWKQKRRNIVRLGNIHKFNQNRELGEYLLKTGDRILVEASPVDTVWGVGLAADNEDIQSVYQWQGLNLLGFVLMEVRDFLSEFGFFDSHEIDIDAQFE